MNTSRENRLRKSPQSVLIVDDDSSQSRTLAMILTRMGIEVITACSGKEALEQLKQKNFSMIFMDVRMPEMDGVETFKNLKKFRPDAKVTMMTAYAVEEKLESVLEAGAFEVVFKPLDIEQIVSIINRS